MEDSIIYWENEGWTVEQTTENKDGIDFIKLIITRQPNFQHIVEYWDPTTDTLYGRWA